MRINKFVAQATGLSRRHADEAIVSARVTINGRPAILGDVITSNDIVMLDGKRLAAPSDFITIILNKPKGYVCSRVGQGSKTIYELLPEKYHRLKPVGRLDKDSSGLLLLTNDGDLANRLTHPRHGKKKVYRVTLNKKLDPNDKSRLLTGVKLRDGLSKFSKVSECSEHTYDLTIGEGRNRQIRRTMNTLGYKILALHRISSGNLVLDKDLKPGGYQRLEGSV